jgi:hypothetical protein
MNMKKGRVLFTCAAAVALVSLSSIAQAKEFSPELPAAEMSLPPKPNLVTPGDTFSFDVVVFNNTSEVAAYAVSPIDTTFGTTTTYTGVGLGGSNVTITSSESIGVSTTTDTFTISTPSNFAPTGYKIGTKAIQGVEFDIDQDTTYADPVNTLTPITGYTATGTATYLVSDVFAESPVVTGTSTAYGAYEGIGVGSGSINADEVSAFTLSISYPTLVIPEPSSVALGGLGLIGCGFAVGGRRRKAALAA